MLVWFIVKAPRESFQIVLIYKIKIIFALKEIYKRNNYPGESIMKNRMDLRVQSEPFFLSG